MPTSSCWEPSSLFIHAFLHSFTCLSHFSHAGSTVLSTVRKDRSGCQLRQELSQLFFKEGVFFCFVLLFKKILFICKTELERGIDREIFMCWCELQQPESWSAPRSLELIPAVVKGPQSLG